MKMKMKIINIIVITTMFLLTSCAGHVVTINGAMTITDTGETRCTFEISNVSIVDQTTMDLLKTICKNGMFGP